VKGYFLRAFGGKGKAIIAPERLIYWRKKCNIKYKKLSWNRRFIGGLG